MLLNSLSNSFYSHSHSLFCFVCSFDHHFVFSFEYEAVLISQKAEAETSLLVSSLEYLLLNLSNRRKEWVWNGQ